MIESTNLDPESSEPLPWQRALAQLERLQPAGGSRGPTCWLSTIGQDGRPHLAGVVGHWLDDTLYFVSGPGTRKARNLVADERCSFAISLPDLDLVLDGTATRVTDPATLARIAEGYAARGWPLQVEGDMVTASFWAPTAPPPPWHLHAFTATSALGVATASPGGATRWRFRP
jgi:hypothetical protein